MLQANSVLKNLSDKWDLNLMFLEYKSSSWIIVTYNVVSFMNHEWQYYEFHIFTCIFWELLHVDSKINIPEYANAYANFMI